jgi:two-component system, cell cycle response regulator CpdR
MPRFHPILIANDDPDLTEVISGGLSEAGYAVLTAANGYEAIGVLADNWVSLLITDIRMPGIDGFELARQAKVMRPTIKVIYLGGAPEKGAGAVHGPVLQKPIRIADLLGEVHRQLV